MTVENDNETPGTLRLFLQSIDYGATSTTVMFHRSDTATDDYYGTDSGIDLAEVLVRMQTLANLLATQNATIMTMIGNSYTGNANGHSGPHSVDITIVSGASHADSMTVNYRRSDTNAIENYAANTTDTEDYLFPIFTSIAQGLADALQAQADSDSVVGLEIVGTPQ